MHVAMHWKSRRFTSIGLGKHGKTMELCLWRANAKCRTVTGIVVRYKHTKSRVNTVRT